MESNRSVPGPQYETLVQLLRTADTIWNASRAFFERWNLGPSQFNVLNLLHQTPAGLSQTDLSRELVMHRSNVTGLLDRLEKRGLAERKEVQADRRAYRVVLTEAGLRLMQEVLPLYYQSAGRVWDHLSAKKAGELTAELLRAARNAKRIAAELPTVSHSKEAP